MFTVYCIYKQYNLGFTMSMDARFERSSATVHPGIYPIRHSKLQSVAKAVQCRTGAITFSSTGRSGSNLERKMFTASNNTTRLAAFSFAMLMAVVVNGGMLMKFDSVAQEVAADNTQPSNVAVLETVTVVGRRV